MLSYTCVEEELRMHKYIHGMNIFSQYTTPMEDWTQIGSSLWYSLWY